MKSRVLVCAACLLANSALAHRLDEYLQAMRVAVSTNGVELSIELTPAVAIADQVIAIIDKNHDGQFSLAERDHYARQFLKDLQLKLDEKVSTLRLMDVSFPGVFEMQNGVGIIRLKAIASSDPLTAGKHSLCLTNAHLPQISVYLVNALASKIPAVQITKQTRDELQKDYRLDFEIVAGRR